MPKLSKDDPIIAALPDEIGETLPDVNAIVADVGLVPGGFDPQEVAYRSAKIYQAAGQIGLGDIVSRLGVSNNDAFTQISSMLATDVVATMDDVLVEQAGDLTAAIRQMSISNDLLDNAMKVGIGLSIQLASTVPIIGWLVKLAWTVGNTIAKIVEVVRKSNADDKPPQYPATQFNPEADRDLLNTHVLRQLRTSHDWTHMFRPPGLGVPEQASWLGEFWTADLKGGGKSIATTNACTACLGYVPGTAFLHKSIEIFGLDLKDTGNVYFPSPRQHGLWIWKHLSRHNTPALYTIDANSLVDGWHSYLVTLRHYIMDHKHLSVAQKKRIIDYYDKGGDDSSSALKIFGWGKYSKAMMQGDHLQPVKEALILRSRQLAYLDTLTCAYVDENYGALSDPDVKAKWQQRRKQLLDHPAVCNVDLDMIPDAIYRGQVEYEQQNRPQCKFLGPQDFVQGTVEPPIGQDGAAGLGGSLAQPRRIWLMIGGVAVAVGAGTLAYAYRHEIADAARRLFHRGNRLPSSSRS